MCKAVLDASYKKQTEAYAEITGTSEEEAQQIFEDNLDTTMEQFESSPMPEDPEAEVSGSLCPARGTCKLHSRRGSQGKRMEVTASRSK